MRARRILIRVAIAGAILALVGVFAVRGLLKSDPRWYRPVVFDEAAQAVNYKKLEQRVNTLRNEIGRSQVRVDANKVERWPAFDIELTEDELNGTVSRWQDNHQILGQVTEPHIRFLPGRIELAGRPADGGPLMSIEIAVDETPDGPTVTLGRPWAGRLPLTRSVIDKAQPMIADHLRTASVPPPVATFLNGLIAGESLQPVVVVPSSVADSKLLPARVEKLTIEEGILRATLRPFDPNESPDAAK